MIKLFLDAGHGGKDGGAVGAGILEKNLTLEIAQGIADKLKSYEGIEVKMSRTSDKNLTLRQRTDDANAWGADYFLSIHINSAESTAANGYEDYIYNGNVSSKTVAFQNVMNDEIFKAIKHHGVSNRGKKRANFHVLREAHAPALLTENLFIRNAADADRLKDLRFKMDLIQGHVTGLEKFLGLKKLQTEPPKTTTGGKLYKVQVGAFSERDNAEGLVKVLEASGFKGAFIVEA
jgi:N-acetylmuramoyl-L-alanine amidase